MKFIWMLWGIVLCFTSTAFARSPAKESGKFDYYVLALSWQPAFCEFHSDKPECRSQTESRYDATHLVLHGLWPSVRGDSRHEYGFCGISRDIQEKDRKGAWCETPALNLADKERLTALMPGAQSCLERHEWFRHGSCSGLSEVEYFTKSLDLVEQIAKTKFSAYLTSHIGKRVTLRSILDVFEKDFGKGSSRSLILRCDSQHGTSLLTEVQLFLKKESLSAPLSSESFVRADEAEKGSCRKQIAIDAVGK